MLLQNLLDPRVSDDLLQITEHLSGRTETRTQIYRSPSLLVYYPPRIHHQASRRLCLHIQPHSPLEQVKEQGLQKTGKIALTDPQEFQFFIAAHQAPPSLGFSRQEQWSGLPFPSPVHESEKWKWSRSVVSDSQWPHGLQPTRLLRPWDFPGNSTGVGCHCLLCF